MLLNTATPEEDTAGNQHQQETELKAMEIKEEETLPLHPPPPQLCLSPVGGSAPSQHCGQLKPHVLRAPCPKNAAADGNHHHRLQPPRAAFLLKHGNQSRIVCMRFRDRELRSEELRLKPTPCNPWVPRPTSRPLHRCGKRRD